MKGPKRRDVMAELAEAATLQDECAEQRLALEWGQFMFNQLVRRWNYLETKEFLAYEEKVTAQVRLLEDTTATLWHLHRRLTQTRRLLKQHRQELRHQTGTIRAALRKDAHEKTLARRPHSPTSVGEGR